MLVFTVFFALSLGFGDTADAKRGGIKSGKSSYTQKTDSATKSDTTQQSNSGTKSNTSSGTGAAAGTAGKASTGGFMKGMLVGGIAGMLFGSMFAGMGAFGDILAGALNIIIMIGILALVVMLVSRVVRMIRGNKPAAAGPYNNRNPYGRRDEDDDRNQRGPF